MFFKSFQLRLGYDLLVLAKFVKMSFIRLAFYYIVFFTKM
jgi:hypothetical protein